MRRVLNPELDRKILEALTEKYHLTERREGIHFSSLIGCLTRGYLDLTAPIEPTDTELLLFATGYALQEVLTPKDAEEPLIEIEGMVFRPDMQFTVELDGTKTLVEIKSTRSGTKRYREGDLPETWLKYMMAGCYARGTNRYELGCIYVSERPSGKLISETIYFEDSEIEENWKWMCSRRDAYKHFLDTDTIPPPRKWCKEWECRYGPCRYSLQCDAIVMLEQRKQAESDIKELWPE